MKAFNFNQVLDDQKKYFNSGTTYPQKFRKEQLKKLFVSIKKYEKEILNALYKDLGKSAFESYTNEVLLIYLEIKYILKHLNSWMKVRKTKLEIHLLPGSGRIYHEPYGNSLIIAPWNYPFQLLMAPLIAAISAGNTAIVKPSELAPATAEVLTTIIEETFAPQFVAIVNGGIEETTALLELPFDKIFFTGSVPVGKIIMTAAAKNLTPVTLELGGKSPVIVDKSANITLAAKKIVWGKFNNAGQTCVAPDYVLVDKSVEKELIEEMKRFIILFYGINPQKSPDYSRIINKKNLERLKKLIDYDKIVFGGKVDIEDLYIEPTILQNVNLNDAIMQDEIFGPIIPILSYNEVDEAVSIIRTFAKPLAMYIFSCNKKIKDYFLQSIRFGGGGVNSTILHVTSTNLPFGGVGASGTGSYHGKAGFDCFSHSKSILSQPTFIDLNVTYPNKKIPLGLLRKIME